MFLNPLGLLALLSVPAVVGLHLYRRRFERHPVSALFLWAAQDHAPVAGRQREPLRTSASFWCELLAALLLSLALAGLRVPGSGDARHLVVVLDGSASMSAVVEGTSLRTRALEEVRALLAELSSGSQVTILVSGPSPTTLAGPAAFRAEAQEALEGYAPRLGVHDLAPTLGLAGQLAAGGDVLLVTDRYEPDNHPPEVGLVAVGTATDNLAITHASRRRVRDDGGREVSRVQLTVTNHGTRAARVTLRFAADGSEVARRPLELAPGGREHVGLNLPAGTGVLTVHLPDDALAIDNTAYLAPEPARTLRLASTLEPALARYLGLAGDDDPTGIARWLELVPDTQPAEPADAHLVLAEGLVPGDAWVLALEQRGEQRQHLIGPFLTDKRHPVLEGVTLEGIVWARSPDLDLGAGAPIVSAGDTPLLTEGRDGDRVILRANLDPLVSSLHRSPDWPILLANLAEMRRRELPGLTRTSLGVGDRLTYRATRPARYALTGPDGVALELRALGSLVVEDVRDPGLYQLDRVGEDGARAALGEVAYSFLGAGESDLRGLSAGDRSGDLSLAGVRASHTFLETLLIVLILALVLGDWWVLQRGARRLKLEDRR